MALTKNGQNALAQALKFYRVNVDFTAKELSAKSGETISAITLNSLVKEGYLDKREGTTPKQYSLTRYAYEEYIATQQNHLLEKLNGYKFHSEELNILQQRDMTYREYVAHLLQKYGPLPGPYTLKNLNGQGYCKNTQITRKGLEIHHIFEDMQADLSNEIFWGIQELQAAEALVYANYLEHAILHFLISKEHPNSTLGKGGLFNHHMFKRTQMLLEPQDYLHFGYLIALVSIDLYEKTFAVLENRDIVRQPISLMKYNQELLYNYLMEQYPYGITPISTDDYAAMGFKTGLLANKPILVLHSQQDYFMFVAQGKTLQICNGGATKKLQHTDPYWYLYRMDRYAQFSDSLWKQYHSTLQPIIDLITSCGGTGVLHGNIIDIDYFHHVQVDIANQQLIPYAATSISSRTIFPSVQELLKHWMEQRTLVPELSQVAQFQDALITSQDLMKIEQSSALLGLTTPICSEIHEDATKGFYSQNRNLRRLQKGLQTNIIVSWEASLENEEVWKTEAIPLNEDLQNSNNKPQS